MKQPYMTCSEVGRIVGLTPAAIRAAERSGRIRAALKTAGGLRLFEPAEVKRFARARAKDNTAAA